MRQILFVVNELIDKGRGLIWGYGATRCGRLDKVLKEDRMRKHLLRIELHVRGVFDLLEFQKCALQLISAGKSRRKISNA